MYNVIASFTSSTCHTWILLKSRDGKKYIVQFRYCIGTIYKAVLEVATVVLIYLQLLQSKNSCNSQTLHSETKTQTEFEISVTWAEMTSLQPKEKLSTTK